MTNLRKALPKLAFVLALSGFLFFLYRDLSQPSLPAVFAQGAPAANCNAPVFTFTGTATQASQTNHSGTLNTPCVSFGVTLETTGTLAATLQFETSPDNSTWTAVPNTICSTSPGTVPCVVFGANPIGTLATSGAVLVRIGQPFWRLNVTATSGTGTGTAKIYGVIITASAGGGGGSGGAGATGATGASGAAGSPGATGASGPSGAAGAAGATGASGAAGAAGATGATGASGAAGSSAAALSNLTPVTVSANTTSDQTLQEVSITAGYFNTLKAANILHGSGILTIGLAQTPTLTFKIKLCTVSGCGSGTVVTLVSIVSGSSVAATNDGWNINVIAATSTTGATGAFLVHGNPGLSVDIGASPGSAATVYVDTNTAASSTIDLTAALFLDFTVATSAGSTLNSFTQQIAEVLPQGTSGGGGASVSPPYLTVSGVSYGPVWSLTAPPLTGWTADNLGGSSTFDTSTGYAFLSLVSTGTNQQLEFRTSPSTPYSFVVYIQTMNFNTSGTNSGYYTVGFREGSSGKLDQIMIGSSGSNIASFIHCWYANSTTFTACGNQVITSQNQGLINANLFIKIRDDGTNLTWSVSADGGLHFTQVDTAARTAHFTTAPNQWFFGAQANAGTFLVALLSAIQGT